MILSGEAFFNAMVPDTLDPHVTQAGPIVNVHSAIFSKLLQYDDERAGTIVPDLADGMPEQPDALTYITSKYRPRIRCAPRTSMRRSLAGTSAATQNMLASTIRAAISSAIG